MGPLLYRPPPRWQVLGALAGALALTRLMKNLLFDVSPADPQIFLLVPAVLSLWPYRLVQQEMGLRRSLEDWSVPWASFLASSSHADTWLLSLVPSWRINEVMGPHLFPGIAPLALGIVRGATEVGLFRGAQAPQQGFAILSAPLRLILLTEQTRDWEHGREGNVLRGLRSYTLAALGVAAVAVPVFLVAMPWLVRVVFGSEYLPAVDAARIVLVAAAIQLVLGWSKSLPVTVGRPHLRIVTHGVETLVLLPLVVVLGDRWGVTGAAVAFLVSTLVFAATWAVVLVRLRAELRATGRVGAPRAAAP